MKFKHGVSEPLYAFEVTHCRSSRWYATRRMLEKRRNRAHWSVLLAVGIGGALLPVKLFA